MNDEHAAILKKGTEGWNQWREANPEVKLDLSNADLGSANLTRARYSSKTVWPDGFEPAQSGATLL